MIAAPWDWRLSIATASCFERLTERGNTGAARAGARSGRCAVYVRAKSCTPRQVKRKYDSDGGFHVCAGLGCKVQTSDAR
jgi:hypothetical protein